MFLYTCKQPHGDYLYMCIKSYHDHTPVKVALCTHAHNHPVIVHLQTIVLLLFVHM